MADPTCTLNPKHSRRKLETAKERRQGYCAECFDSLEVDARVRAKNERAAARQTLKDEFIAAHPELVRGDGVFFGETAATILAHNEIYDTHHDPTVNWADASPVVERAHD
jgi:hypothetical protein